MAGKFFILRQVADFAPGLFENTVMADGCVQLIRRGSGFVQQGQYTTPPYGAEPFFSLIPSWNADVPAGARVEMQVRVSADGSWSRWFGFGAWCPYEGHASPEPEQDALARTDGETLSLLDGQPAATAVQLRVILTATDTAQSPQVRLMAASTNAPQQMGTEVTVFDRDLELPAYSCLTRDPALAGRIAGATSLTMMMNRWGRDLLPEEVARAVYDSRAARYGNLVLLAATAGMYGFRGHIAYAGISALRHEIWQGRAVAARVHYRAPALGATTGTEEEDMAALPVLRGSTTGSSGHLVAVRGFIRRDDQELVLLHDPLSPTDAGVLREVLLADFARIYTGLALFMDKGDPGAGRMRPQRKVVTLDPTDGHLRLLDAEGNALTPEALAEAGYAPLTLCYTISDSVAYASAAQRRFYYPTPDDSGALRYDRSAAAGRRLTAYIIASKGNTWVAEKRLPKPETLRKDGAKHDL